MNSRHIFAVITCIFLGCSSDSNSNNGADLTLLTGEQVGQILCPFESACDGRDPGSCVRNYLDDDFITDIFLAERLRASTLASCVQSANSCEDYQRCKGTEDCQVSRCDGSTLLECNDGKIRPRNCAAEGLSCIGATCGVPNEVCTSEFACSGDVFLWCPGDGQEIPIAVNCAVLGKSCSNGLCTDQSSSSCTEGTCGADGVSLSYCVGGVPIEGTCANLSESLVCEVGASEPNCVANPTECDSLDGDTCEGGRFAVSCRNGKQYRVDCAAAGAECVLPDGSSIPTCEIPG